MAFSKDLNHQAERYNVTPRDVLFCQLIAAGADRGDAYTAIYYRTNGRITEAAATTAASDMIKDNPAFTALIRSFKISLHKLRNGKIQEEDSQEPTPPEEQDKREQELKQRYSTREGLIKELMKSTDNLSGKDELNGLLTLAKVQGYDRPEEREGRELRRFFIAFKSDCRRCKLMELYRSIENQETP